MFRRYLFIGLMPIVLALSGMSSCAGTKAAYKESQGDLRARVYVIAEHYEAVSGEAANLVEQAGTPPAVKTAIKEANKIASPVFLGDPSATPPRPDIKELLKRYEAVKDDDSRAALVQALDAGNRAMFGLIKALKDARANFQSKAADPVGEPAAAGATP